MADLIILNLDELIPPKKYITFQQEKHEIKHISMDSYLKMMQLRRKLMREAGGQEDDYATTMQAVELVHLALPSIPKDVLSAIPVAAMIKLTQVIEKEMDLSGDNKEGAGSSNQGESTSS